MGVQRVLPVADAALQPTRREVHGRERVKRRDLPWRRTLVTRPWRPRAPALGSRLGLSVRSGKKSHKYLRANSRAVLFLLHFSRQTIGFHTSAPRKISSRARFAPMIINRGRAAQTPPGGGPPPPRERPRLRVIILPEGSCNQEIIIADSRGFSFVRTGRGGSTLGENDLSRFFFFSIFYLFIDLCFFSMKYIFFFVNREWDWRGSLSSWRISARELEFGGAETVYTHGHRSSSGLAELDFKCIAWYFLNHELQNEWKWNTLERRKPDIFEIIDGKHFQIGNTIFFWYNISCIANKKTKQCFDLLPWDNLEVRFVPRRQELLRIGWGRY